jgi:hypothetical protein
MLSDFIHANAAVEAVTRECRAIIDNGTSCMTLLTYIPPFGLPSALATLQYRDLPLHGTGYSPCASWNAGVPSGSAPVGI